MSILKCRLLYLGGHMFALQATMNMKVNQVYPKSSLFGPRSPCGPAAVSGPHSGTRHAVSLLISPRATVHSAQSLSKILI